MKKTQPAKKKIGRPTGQRPVLALRIDKRLYDRLVAAAEGPPSRPLAEEAVSRIAQTFMHEDHFGKAIQRLAIMLAAEFSFAGEQYARAHGIDPSPDHWLGDLHCYRAAALQAAQTLIESLPTGDPHERMLAVESLKGRVMTRILNEGQS